MQRAAVRRMLRPRGVETTVPNGAGRRHSGQRLNRATDKVNRMPEDAFNPRTENKQEALLETGKMPVRSLDAAMPHAPIHVMQAPGAGQTIQRDPADSPEDEQNVLEEIWEDPVKAAEEIATDQLERLANQPSDRPSLYSHTGCPPTFCQPFSNYYLANAELKWAGAVMLAGIANKVDSRVVWFWLTYIGGGSESEADLTPEFGKDFRDHPKTKFIADYLVGSLRRHIEQYQDDLMVGNDPVEIDFTQRLSTELEKIDQPSSAVAMEFHSGVLGNLVGGIGKDQLSVEGGIGKRPSKQVDSRTATIVATLTRNEDGGLTVKPEITFTVLDTLDLCPGHCGAPPEQVATVPLSRFEATGLTGDVPLKAVFKAPVSALTPFTIPPV